MQPERHPANSYLTQILDGVYTNPDPRTYPISSYSYMIIPTGTNDPRMTTAKRQTLADFLYYSLCTGQRKAGPYGYSPLPLNLVQAGFGQIAKLGRPTQGGAVSGVHIKNPSANVTTCNNPTFVKGDLSANHLAQIAPMPLAVPEGDEPAVRRRHRDAGDQRQRPAAATDTSGTTLRRARTTNGTDQRRHPAGRHRSPAGRQHPGDHRRRHDDHRRRDAHDGRHHADRDGARGPGLRQHDLRLERGRSCCSRSCCSPGSTSRGVRRQKAAG